MISPGGAETYGGMTLRDYFAAKVFAAAVSAVGGKEFDEAKFAKTAYVCADALIAERAQ